MSAKGLETGDELHLASRHSPSDEKKQCPVTLNASQFAVMSALPMPTSVATLPLIVTTLGSLEENCGLPGEVTNWLPTQSLSFSNAKRSSVSPAKPKNGSGLIVPLRKFASHGQLPTQLKLLDKPLTGLYSTSLPMKPPLCDLPAQSSWPPVTVNGITFPRTSFTCSSRSFLMSISAVCPASRRGPRR